MLQKTFRLFGWLGTGIFILVAVAFLALSNSEGLQDRLVAISVQNNVAAGLVDDWGGDNLEVAFCGTASPMGNGLAFGTTDIEPATPPDRARSPAKPMASPASPFGTKFGPPRYDARF